MMRCVGVGNPLWDVFAPAANNGSLLARFGRGTTHHVDPDAMQGVLAEVRDAVRVPGGGARNTLAVLAALGRQTYLVGTVGADADGDRYRSALAQNGITDCLTEVPDVPTGASLTLLSPGGPSTLIVAPGAAEWLDRSGVAAAGQPSMVIFEGFLADRPQIAEATVDYAVTAGAPLVVDLGHPGVASAAAAVVEAADRRRTPGAPRPLVFATEAEVAATASSLEAGISRLTAGAELLALKRGANGAAVYRGAGGRGDREPGASAGDESGARSAEAPGVAPPVVVDTTGAGDVFAGAFLEARLRGRSDDDACRLASFAAGLSLGDYGGGLDRARLERLQAAFAEAE